MFSPAKGLKKPHVPEGLLSICLKHIRPRKIETQT